jgi:nicotinamidase-related amidase
MSTALLLIDIQNDYFPGGKMELAGSLEASRRARQLLSSFRDRKMPVVHVQHLSTRAGATFFVPGTPGVEIQEGVSPLPGETVIQKSYPNSFRATPLLDRLQENGVGHVVIAGMMTHMCVDSTVRAAFDLGLECTVVHDACATRALSFGERLVPAEEVHAAFLAALKGAFARVVSSEEFLKA